MSLAEAIAHDAAAQGDAVQTAGYDDMCPLLSATVVALLRVLVNVCCDSLTLLLASECRRILFLSPPPLLVSLCYDSTPLTSNCRRYVFLSALLGFLFSERSGDLPKRLSSLDGL